MPPTLQNNVTDEGEIEAEEFFEDPDQDMNYFGEQLTEEDFLNSEYYDADVFETENDLNLEVTADIY